MYQRRKATGETLANLVKVYRKIKEDPYDNDIINNIDQGSVIVNYDFYDMNRKVIPNIHQSIIMPVNFMVQKAEDFIPCFAIEHRPEVVYAGKDNETLLTFSLTNIKITEHDDVIKARDNLLRSFADSNDIYDIDDVELHLSEEEKTIAIFSYITSVIDRTIWELCFFMEVDNKLLMGSFRCDADLKEEWVTISKQMLWSLRSSDNEDE